MTLSSLKNDDKSLVETISTFIHDNILKGHFKPGSHLSESHLCHQLNISRNTLREVFRNLTKDGLLRHEINKGVFVITPDLATIIDVYSVRRIIETGAILHANALQNGIELMHKAIEKAEQSAFKNDWLQVGTADIEFHNAIVSLAGSKRLSQQFEKTMIELRLIFGLLDDPKYLHTPYVTMNKKLLSQIEEGQYAQAVTLLEQYLNNAERMILCAYTQKL